MTSSRGGLSVRIEKIGSDRWVVRDDNGNPVGGAHREGVGRPWMVFRWQWRGANGAGKVGGFPGGALTVGTVAVVASQALQERLIRAMLTAIAEQRRGEHAA
jgi:hypothetical protein